jgi:hypothetical protein
MRTHFFLFSALIFFLLVSCKKSYFEQAAIEYKDALSKVEFGCNEIEEKWYVSALLNGKKICYYNGQDNYFANTGEFVNTRTSGPYLDPKDTASILNSAKNLRFGITHELAHLQESLYFNTPLFPPETEWSEIAEESFKLGELPLLSNLPGVEDNYFNSKGFNITLNIPYKSNPNSNGFTGYEIQSRNGSQDNSHLEIVKLDKLDANGYLYYNIEMEFECNLYHMQESYGRLEDGKLVMQVKVKK